MYDEFMAHRPYSDKIWFSPRYVIQEWANIERSGDKKKIKRAREAWVCAVAMTCHSKIEPVEWWIQIPQNDPPDVLAMKLVPHVKGLGNTMEQLQVEVFEISEHDTEDIEKSIERKLGEKDYSGMTLIAFVRRKQVFAHEKVATYIQNLKPKALAIFLVANEATQGTNFSFIGIFPQVFKYQCDWGAMCKVTNQNDFTTATRGTKVPEKTTDYTADTMTLVP
jgi:hypothetical protein